MVVLGMHRSGTSAVAAMLAECGFFPGDELELMPGDENNPGGYFERLDVVEANDGVLGALGGAWDAPPRPEDVRAFSHEFTPMLQAALAAVTATSGEAPSVLKDPRITVLLPAWLPVLGEGHALVLALRHPLETARSLKRRDGIPLAAGLALWEAYLTSALESLEGREIHVVRYEEVLGAPALAVDVVTSLRDLLGPGFRERVHPDRAGRALDPALRRQEADHEALLTHATAHQLELWEHLSSLSTGKQAMSTPAGLRGPSLLSVKQDTAVRGAVAALRLRLAEADQAYGAARAESDARAQRIAALEAEVGELARERDARGLRVAELEARLGVAEAAAARLAQTESALQNAERERERLRASAADALNRVRTEAMAQQELKRQLAAAHETAADVMADRDALLAELEAARTSATWRIGRLFLGPFSRLVRLLGRGR